MRKTNTTWNLIRISLLCGALSLAVLGTPVIAAAQSLPDQPYPNQPAQPAKDDPVLAPDAQPVSPDQTPNTEQAQPAQQPEQKPEQKPEMTTPDKPKADQSQPAVKDSTATSDKDQIKDRDNDNKKLPKTASNVPLIGMLGVFAFGSALFIHAGRRQAGW